MIDFDDLEIGSVYTVTKPLYTSDYTHYLSDQICFIIVAKNKIKFRSATTVRIEIIFNDLKQVLLFSLSENENYHERNLPLKKIM